VPTGKEAPSNRLARRVPSARAARAKRKPSLAAPETVKATASPATGASRTRGAAGRAGAPAAPADPAPTPTAPEKREAHRRGRRSGQKVADLSPAGFPADTPTRSSGANKTGAKERSAMRNVALDLGTTKTSYCEVCRDEVVKRATVSSVESLQCLLGPEQPPARVAIEACREAWYVYDLLTSWGNDVLLVDTTRSKQLGIGQHGRKTDKIDAQKLALAVERGGIPTAHILSPHRRELRRWLGMRRALVEARAHLVTTLRGLAREQGVKLPSCPVETFAANVRKRNLTPSLQALLESGLQTLETIGPQLNDVEAQLAQLCAVEPVVQLLATAPGVALIVAASFVSVIDEAQRFQQAHEVESYLGLVPSENSSGGRQRLGAISKQGNGYLRTLLVQAAWSLWRTADRADPLRQWTDAVAKRRGKRVAVVALARRLAGVLWAMWRDGTVYEPEALAGNQARGVRRQAQTLEYQAASLERAARKRSFKRSKPIQEVATA
jgi:transposase